MSNKIIDIPGRLHSVAKEGVVTGANEIFDDEKGKTQAQVNADVQSEIDDIKDGSTESIKDLRQDIDSLEQNKIDKSSITTSTTETEPGKVVDATVIPVIKEAIDNWAETTVIERGVAIDVSNPNILKFQTTGDASDVLNLSVQSNVLVLQGTAIS